MESNWLLAEVRRTSRNRLIAAALVLAAVVGLLAWNAPYLGEYFRGPAALSPADLERVPSLDAQPRKWVRVEVQRLEEIGLTEVTVRKSKRGVERGRSVSATYFAAVLDARVLLVKVAGDQAPGKVLVGELKPIEDGAAQALFKGADAAQLRAAFLPMELHVHDYRSDGHLVLLIAAAGFLGALLYGWFAWGRLGAPEKHPAARKAQLWGGIDAVAGALERARTEGLLLGGWRIGERFLLRTGALDIQVHNLDELLWAYLEVTKKKMYFVIPAGQSQAVVLKWRGASVKIEGKEEALLEALQHIASHQPWVVFGYNDEVKTLYDKQVASFASQVGKARQRWQAEAQQAQAAAGFAATQPQDLTPTQPQSLATA